MSFTFSHPAIVLPFKNWKLFSMTGLVVGSMIPDFEFFIRMRMYGNAFGHTLVGLFCFDLPLGILAAFIFHNIVRDSLLRNLPYFLKARLYRFTMFNWNEYFHCNKLKVIISILLGAVSHLFWDNLTHGYGFFVQYIPVLTYRIMIGIIDMPVYWFLQYFSSALGLVSIAWVVWCLPANNSVAQKINYWYWLKVFLVFLIVVGVKKLLGFDNTWGQPIAITISAGLLAVTLAPLILLPFRAREKK
ncbi:MAG: DUF4184 family protein [Bacteroidales bacterium]|jgi:hypothetical protein|nr:DUF4184 family protein [Bacteroidales bacterium]